MNIINVTNIPIVLITVFITILVIELAKLYVKFHTIKIHSKPTIYRFVIHPYPCKVCKQEIKNGEVVVECNSVIVHGRCIHKEYNSESKDYDYTPFKMNVEDYNTLILILDEQNKRL